MLSLIIKLSIPWEHHYVFTNHHDFAGKNVRKFNDEDRSLHEFVMAIKHCWHWVYSSTWHHQIFNIYSTICCCFNEIPIFSFTKLWITLVVNGVSREFMNMTIVSIIFWNSVGNGILFIICARYIFGTFSYCWKIFIEI